MQLSEKSLMDISARTPEYDRSTVRPGIVHLGIGAFHRGHQAVYVDNLLAQAPDWGIIGASLRSPDTAHALNPQDGLYTLIEKSEGPDRFRVIGSVSRVLVASDNFEELLQTLSAPEIRIVSLTITEKGYCHDPATGKLNTQHPDIVADVSNPKAPISAPGILIEALRRRRDSGIAPFTILSCDNLPSNGRLCQRVVLSLAEIIEPQLAKWIENNVSFPGTMVDRIVPATKDADRRKLKDDIGLEDAWPVVTEPFSQWVIEDNFCAGRPPFEDVGVQMVEDVEPFETMKLRLLNGSHSTLAYLGSIAGYETVAQAMNDEALAHCIKDLMKNEVAPTLSMPSSVDLDAYQQALLRRFHNPGLQHLLQQIASDGSQKLPQRILNPIRDRLADQRSIDQLAKCVAAWIRFISDRKDGLPRFQLNDPMAEQILNLVDETQGNTDEMIMRILSIKSVFGSDLIQNEEFLRSVSASYMKFSD